MVYNVYLHGPSLSGKTATLVAIHDYLRKRKDIYNIVKVSNGLMDEVRCFSESGFFELKKSEEEYIEYIHNNKKLKIKICVGNSGPICNEERIKKYLEKIEIIKKNSNSLLIILVNPLHYSPELAWDTFVYWFFKRLNTTPLVTKTELVITTEAKKIMESIFSISRLVENDTLDKGIYKAFKVFANTFERQESPPLLKHICLLFSDGLKYYNEVGNPMDIERDPSTKYRLQSRIQVGNAVDEDLVQTFLGDKYRNSSVEYYFKQLFEGFKYNYYGVDKLIQGAPKERLMVALTNRDRIPEDHYTHLMLEKILDDILNDYNRLKRVEFVSSVFRIKDVFIEKNGLFDEKESLHLQYVVDEDSTRNLLGRIESFIDSYLDSKKNKRSKSDKPENHEKGSESGRLTSPQKKSTLQEPLGNQHSDPFNTKSTALPNEEGEHKENIPPVTNSVRRRRKF